MIKSVVSVLLCAFLLLSLCACTNEKEFHLSEFSRAVSFTIDDIAVKGRLDFKNQDDITFTVTEPENLKDISFTASQITKDDITINYSKQKDESPVFILLNIIKNIAESDIYLPMKGEFTFTGAVSSAEYKAIFDCEKEEITRIQAEKFSYNFE